MKAVVTGAAGFAGCSLVEALLAEGHEVYAVLRPQSEHNVRLEKTEGLQLIYVDRKDFSKLDQRIGDSCDVFFHLAWQGARDDFQVQQENISDTLGALEAASRLGCRRFIGTGSQAEYGLHSGLVTEETLPMPKTAYGAAKLAACYLVKRRSEQLGVEWIWGRIFSLYGKYEPQTTMLSYLVNSLRQGKSPKLTACTQNWDYLDVRECAGALISLAKFGKSGNIYNVANGNYRILKDFVEDVRRQIAPDVPVLYGRDSQQKVSLQPSVKKIYRDTGWRAKQKFLIY